MCIRAVEYCLIEIDKRISSGNRNLIPLLRTGSLEGDKNRFVNKYDRSDGLSAFNVSLNTRFLGE